MSLFDVGPNFYKSGVLFDVGPNFYKSDVGRNNDNLQFERFLQPNRIWK